MSVRYGVVAAKDDEWVVHNGCACAVLFGWATIPRMSTGVKLP